MTDIVTDGVTVGEETGEAIPPPAPVRFRIDDAIEWLRDPKNDAEIRAWSRRVNTSVEHAVNKVAKEVGKVGTLMKEAFTEDGVGEAIAKDLLKRAFPGDDWDRDDD
jgi:hypothetical protein